jgi:2-polyprenyl-3-methyl-5-hydroxy-6-metoxy-1,4-benzoquinol methylase
MTRLAQARSTEVAESTRDRDVRRHAGGEPACAVCGSSGLERFFELPELPVNCIALHPSRESARACTKGRIDLAWCPSCGAITNTAFDSTLVHYDPSYDNSLHFSPTFQQYADSVAADLIVRHGLNGKTIVDIGCGNGEFLAMLCQGGRNRGIGFDPSFIPGRMEAGAEHGIRIVRDYYSPRYQDHAADLIICRHVLEHIVEPQHFLRAIRATLESRPRTSVFFEVPNASFVFRNNGIWDVIYEHCFYYQGTALVALFTSCGFDVQDVRASFSGQYLCLDATVSAAGSGTAPGAFALDPTGRDDLVRFVDHYRTSVATWERMLQRFRDEGKRVALWGAGAKGAMFLNALVNAGDFGLIVDINPHKHGLYIPGTGQPVAGPQVLVEYKPAVVLVMNPNYGDEVRQQISTMGIEAEVMTF